MRPEVSSNRFEVSLRGKISLWCKLTSYLRSHYLRRSETHFGANFTSANLKKTGTMCGSNKYS